MRRNTGYIGYGLKNGEVLLYGAWGTRKDAIAEACYLTDSGRYRSSEYFRKHDDERREAWKDTKTRYDVVKVKVTEVVG